LIIDFLPDSKIEETLQHFKIMIFKEVTINYPICNTYTQIKNCLFLNYFKLNFGNKDNKNLVLLENG
jgi:hypothetical protein